MVASLTGWCDTAPPVLRRLHLLLLLLLARLNACANGTASQLYNFCDIVGCATCQSLPKTASAIAVLRLQRPRLCRLYLLVSVLAVHGLDGARRDTPTPLFGPPRARARPLGRRRYPCARPWLRGPITSHESYDMTGCDQRRTSPRARTPSVPWPCSSTLLNTTIAGPRGEAHAWVGRELRNHARSSSAFWHVAHSPAHTCTKSCLGNTAAHQGLAPSSLRTIVGAFRCHESACWSEACRKEHPAAGS